MARLRWLRWGDALLGWLVLLLGLSLLFPRVPAETAMVIAAGLLVSDADLVLVTARHGFRLIIARPGHDAAEGLSVRRTRVLLLPASAARQFSG